MTELEEIKKEFAEVKELLNKLAEGQSKIIAMVYNIYHNYNCAI